METKSQKLERNIGFYTLDDTAFSRTNYSLIGWNFEETKSNEEPDISCNQYISEGFSSSKKLYACWRSTINVDVIYHDNNCLVSVECDENGRILESSNINGLQDSGTNITATVQPNDGWYFKNWKNGETVNPLTTTINSDYYNKAYTISVIVLDSTNTSITLNPSTISKSTTDDNYTFNANNGIPTGLTVTYKDTQIIKDTDFSVVYLGYDQTISHGGQYDTKSIEASCYVTGIGQYTGTVSKTYTLKHTRYDPTVYHYLRAKLDGTKITENIENYITQATINNATADYMNVFFGSFYYVDDYTSGGLFSITTSSNCKILGWSEGSIEPTTYTQSSSNSFGPITADHAWVWLTSNTDHYYYVKFQPGEGTGTMSNQTISCGVSTPLNTCTFTAPSGKSFKNWTDGTTTYSNGQYVTNLTSEGNTKELSAQWGNMIVLSYTLGSSSGLVTCTANPSSGTTIKCTYTKGSSTSGSKWTHSGTVNSTESVTFTATKSGYETTTLTVSVTCSESSLQWDHDSPHYTSTTTVLTGYTYLGNVYHAYSYPSLPSNAGKYYWTSTEVAGYFYDTCSKSKIYSVV